MKMTLRERLKSDYPFSIDRECYIAVYNRFGNLKDDFISVDELLRVNKSKYLDLFVNDVVKVEGYDEDYFIILDII